MDDNLRIPADVVEKLDEEANKARLAARRAGHSHDIAVGSALRADGRAVGRATH